MKLLSSNFDRGIRRMLLFVKVRNDIELLWLCKLIQGLDLCLIPLFLLNLLFGVIELLSNTKAIEVLFR